MLGAVEPRTNPDPTNNPLYLSCKLYSLYIKGAVDPGTNPDPTNNPLYLSCKLYSLFMYIL